MPTLIKDLTEISKQNVRLILPEGNVIISKADAFAKALEAGLDLVLVQDGDIPVVKMTDFTKLEYEKTKTVKGGKSKKPKQIQIGPRTQEYDLKRFAAKAAEFIEEGHPVSLKLEVHGRDKGFRDINIQQMKNFVALVPNAKPGSVSISEDGKSYTQSLT